MCDALTTRRCVQFMQAAHPPARKVRGRTPRVHTGFLASWTGNGMRERVIEHMNALLDSSGDRAGVHVMCTGHSLGGAIASLAAIDFVRCCGLGRGQVGSGAASVALFDIRRNAC